MVIADTHYRCPADGTAAVAAEVTLRRRDAPVVAQLQGVANLVGNDLRGTLAGRVERPAWPVAGSVPVVHVSHAASAGGSRGGGRADTPLATVLRRGLVDVNVRGDVDVEWHVVLGHPLPDILDLGVADIGFIVSDSAPRRRVTTPEVNIEHADHSGQALQRNDPIVVTGHVAGHILRIKRRHFLRTVRRQLLGVQRRHRQADHFV